MIFPWFFQIGVWKKNPSKYDLDLVHSYFSTEKLFGGGYQCTQHVLYKGRLISCTWHGSADKYGEEKFKGCRGDVSLGSKLEILSTWYKELGAAIENILKKNGAQNIILTREDFRVSNQGLELFRTFLKHHNITDSERMLYVAETIRIVPDSHNLTITIVKNDR